MKQDVAAPTKTAEWNAVKADLEARIALRDDEIHFLRNQVKSLKHHLFGTKSEKLHHEVEAQQPSLFELEQPEELDDENESDAGEEETVTVTRRKKARGRKPLPDWLPHEEQVHDLKDEDKVCECGCLKTHIGADRAKVLERIPTILRVVEHVRLKYACKNPDCSVALEGKPGAVQIAPAPPRMIPKSMAGHSLLAHVLTGKFVDWLPFHRIRKQLLRERVRISRQTMGRWATKVGKALEPMWFMMLKDVKQHPYLQMDETTVQVLMEPGKKNSSKSYILLR